MDLTTRLALQKPNPDPLTGDFLDVAVLNANFDKLDAAIGARPVTSTTRPTTPYLGQFIRETDTGKLLYCTATGATPTWEEILAASSFNSLFDARLNSQFNGKWDTRYGSSTAGSVTSTEYQSSATWTKPSTFKMICVELVAGGGGGGGAAQAAASQHSKGGGGGGGEYAKRWFTPADLTGVTTVAITIGAGGTSSVGAGGSAGGDSSFGSLFSCVGGGGGFMTGPNGAAWGAAGGDGGSGGTGTVDFRVAGQGGAFGYGSGALCTGGSGGSSHLGGGGAAVTSGATTASTQGKDALGWGGGGGGALVDTTGASVRGGLGKGGYCIVTVYN